MKMKIDSDQRKMRTNCTYVSEKDNMVSTLGHTGKATRRKELSKTVTYALQTSAVTSHDSNASSIFMPFELSSCMLVATTELDKETPGSLCCHI